MRLGFALLAGMVAGAALRLLWPLTDRALEAAEKPRVARQGKTEMPRRSETLGSAPADAPPGARTMAAIWRESELVPAKTGMLLEPSWLYVSAPVSALLRSETYVEASIVATEALVDEQCVALFGTLKLSPEREDRLRRVLAEMAFARREITTLAEVDPKKPAPSRVQEMIDASDEEHRRRIEELLGPRAFRQFEAHFDTLAAREDLRTAFLRCSAFAAPLTPAQREALVASWVTEKEGARVAAASATFLSPAQHAAFVQWQSDRVAQEKVRELLRQPGFRSEPKPIYTRRPTPPAPAP